MITTSKGKACAFIAVILACLMALSMSPLRASADEGDTNSITIFGVDSLDMSHDATEWEIARAEGLGEDPVFIELYENGKQISGRIPYTPDQDADDTLGAIAHIITLHLDGASPADMLGSYADAARPKISFKVFQKAVGGSPLPGGEMTVYPIYAKLTSPDADPQYRFLGIRTAPATDAGVPVLKDLQIGATYYEGLGEGGNRVSYALERAANGKDNAFEPQNSCYVVTYKRSQENSISGGIKYVDPDGNLVKETIVSNITEETKRVAIEPSFTVSVDNKDVFYRRLHNLNREFVELSAQKSTYTVPVIPVHGMTADAYTVTVEYVDQHGRKLWEDDVNVKNYGYQYTLPETFSMYQEKEAKYYSYVGVDAKAPTPANGASSTESAKEWANPLILDVTLGDADFRLEDGKRKITARYTSENVEIPFTIVEVDGAQNIELARTTHTITPEVTGEEAITYQPENKLFNGNFYEPWAGNTSQITYCWDDIAAGKDLLQYVYYVPEGHVADHSYDLNVQHVNIANGSVIKTDVVTVDPQLNDYLHIVGDSQFTQDGNTYIRLAGQEKGFYHSYYTNVPNRTYTIYYRDSKDTINANTVVNRTQIIETTRDVIVPGTVTAGITAAPVPVTPAADGTPEGVDAGIGAGDGTTIINDDATPLANLDGLDTTTERTIADNENPLASGVSADAQIEFPWIPVFGGLLAVVVAALAGAFFLLRKRNEKSANASRRE